MATVRPAAVVGMLKAVTVGGRYPGKVMVTVSLRLAETLPAASLAQP